MDEIEALISDLGAGADSRRAAAIRELARIGAEAVSPLCVALCAGSVRARMAVLVVLGNIADARAVPAVCRALRDPDPVIREQAAETLGEIGDREAVPALVAALKRGGGYVPERSARALGRIGDPAAVPFLRSLLRSWNVRLRVPAAMVLGRIGHAAAVPDLCWALETGSWELREAAAAALGRICDARAARTLCHSQPDDLDTTRRARVEALTAIGPAGIPALIESLGAKKDDSVAGEALVAMGANAVEPLCAALRRHPVDARPLAGFRRVDRWTGLRANAAVILAVIGDRRATPHLVEAALGDDEVVGLTAITALGLLGDSAAAAALRSLMDDPSRMVRGRAAAALARLTAPVPEMIPALVEALEDFEDGVRTKAAGALSELASTHPSPALRAAIPGLRRLAFPISPRRLVQDPAREDYRLTLAAIEEATDATKDLPLPAAAGAGDAALPIPSSRRAALRHRQEQG